MARPKKGDPVRAAREAFVLEHRGMDRQAMARLMQARGLYSAKTTIIDIRASIQSMQAKAKDSAPG
jgi:hypothetical protein